MTWTVSVKLDHVRSGVKNAAGTRYRVDVDEGVDTRVDELRTKLEQEIDRQLGPRRGCWPLLVALAGLALGIWLLATSR